MSIADRIRAMVADYSIQEIAVSLKMPPELVEGIINGTVDESVLRNYDPSSRITIVDRHIITRGHVLAVLQNPRLAAEMAICLSGTRAVAVIDLEKYPTLPIHLGLDIKSIPKLVNYLWDSEITKIEYKKNLYLYAVPPHTKVNLNLLFRSFQSVIINCSIEEMPEIYPMADVFYLPVPQDDAGIYRLYQISLEYKQHEENSHVIWLCKSNSEKYTSQLRSFSSAHIAGCIDESNYKKQVETILEPFLPANKKKRSWFS